MSQEGKNIIFRMRVNTVNIVFRPKYIIDEVLLRIHTAIVPMALYG